MNPKFVLLEQERIQGNRERGEIVCQVLDKDNDDALVAEIKIVEDLSILYAMTKEEIERKMKKKVALYKQKEARRQQLMSSSKPKRRPSMKNKLRDIKKNIS